MKPNPVTEPLPAAGHNTDLLTRAIGTTVGYHISQCRSGGYVVLVGGSIHSAHTTLVEAVRAMGSVAATEYGESSEPPERAADVTPQEEPERMPRVLRPVPSAAAAPPDPAGVPGRATVALVLVAFTLSNALWWLR